MTDNKIDVLVVDDSKVARQLLTHLLEADPKIRVSGAVADGQAAIDFMNDHAPDVILMDIHMPRLDGFSATRQIMETHPVPIVICSSMTDPNSVATTFRLMEAGAVACLAKPVSQAHPDYAPLAANLVQTVKLMSEVKVVRRWPRSPAKIPRPPAEFPEIAQTANPPANGAPLIAIGASTGGPLVLQTILGGLPKPFPAPILIVQHIAEGFLPGLVDWLNQTTGQSVHIAAHGIEPLPGRVYLAPDGCHMGVSPSGRIFLSREAPENGVRPAVSYLFRTLAEAKGANAVGVLLTGMGRDGATELKRLLDGGAETIAQDEATSIVHGMPGEAIRLGGASQVLAADQIARALTALAGREPVLGKN